MALNYIQNTIFLSDSFTAPGNGTSLKVAETDLFSTKCYTLMATVADINTNVVVALEGSIDGTNWSKVIANQTITSNGTTHYNVANHPLRYVRSVFVSESGGTAATITLQIAASI
jgi:hypothetical protein